MQSWIWNSDHFSPCATIPLTDRGFRYGMSVFESIMVRNGEPVFLRDHLDRLQSACGRVGFAVTLPTDEKYTEAMQTDGLTRIYVTAGDGSATSAASDCRIFILSEPRAPIPSRVYHRGYDLGIAGEPHRPLFGGLKTANYWANLDVFQRGVARSKNETLLLNHAGELISACMANVFIVSRGQIKTPALGSGARAGVMRARVLAQCDVIECVLTRADVEDADEIFLTSSWLGVMPAASLEGRSLARTVTAGIASKFRDHDGKK